MALTSTLAATSTAQHLSSIIKSARDLMRKDKGLNGDLDRLPMLTWILFLKFLDDLERAQEEREQLAGSAVLPSRCAAVSLARLGGAGGRHYR